MGTKQSRPDPSKGHRPRTGRAQPRDAHGVRRPDAKPTGALACDCGVVFHAGRWRWGPPPLADVVSAVCPACERVRARRPAGSVRLHPELDAPEEEVRHMVANLEQAEREEHPLERVMAVERVDGALLVTTTGVHLARRVAHALERRFHRKGTTRYPEHEAVVLVDLGG